MRSPRLAERISAALDVGSLLATPGHVQRLIRQRQAFPSFADSRRATLQVTRADAEGRVRVSGSELAAALVDEPEVQLTATRLSPGELVLSAWGETWRLLDPRGGPGRSGARLAGGNRVGRADGRQSRRGAGRPGGRGRGGPGALRARVDEDADRGDEPCRRRRPRGTGAAQRHPQGAGHARARLGRGRGASRRRCDGGPSQGRLRGDRRRRAQLRATGAGSARRRARREGGAAAGHLGQAGRAGPARHHRAGGVRRGGPRCRGRGGRDRGAGLRGSRHGAQLPGAHDPLRAQRRDERAGRHQAALPPWLHRRRARGRARHDGARHRLGRRGHDDEGRPRRRRLRARRAEDVHHQRPRGRRLPRLRPSLRSASCRCSSSRRASRASSVAASSRRWGCAARRPGSSCSRAVACPPATWSARRAAACCR